MVGSEKSGDSAQGAQDPQGLRAWNNERREFSVAIREESLDARVASADAREAAADDREAEADAWLRAHSLLDEAEAAARRRLRAERALVRRERETARANRASELDKNRPEVSVGATSDYPLAARFAELSTHLFTASSVSEVLDHLVLVAGEVVQGGGAVSVTLQRGDEFTTPAYRGALAHQLDHLQYEHGEGPCLDSASSSGKAFAASADLAVDTTWPDFAKAATAAGCRSVLSLGLFPDATESLPRLGSLNFYARGTHAFEPGDQDVGMLLAAHAGVALVSTTMLSEADLRNVNLERALESRDVIGQAKGILMERQRLTPEQAFDKLRDASNRLNTKLSELARRLIETGETPARQ
ncbi:GAF and ANTAR domain-containing protein [Nocardiopsis oceani]